MRYLTLLYNCMFLALELRGHISLEELPYNTSFTLCISYPHLCKGQQGLFLLSCYLISINFLWPNFGSLKNIRGNSKVTWKFSPNRKEHWQAKTQGMVWLSIHIEKECKCYGCLAARYVFKWYWPARWKFSYHIQL